MGINTDLNVDPYYDDFNEAKQFNRVLFKPGKAVQARELTQLQTILQKQVERFGSNVYKEGTIISGINLTARSDLFYVKINDQVDFTNPSLYDQLSLDDGIKVTYVLVGQTSGLRAEIIKGDNGFQTQDPDLKTLYIKYLNTTQDSDGDVKQFIAGEVLEIRKESDDSLQVSITVATVNNETGKSFGISCEEGVIYQKGHFIFVDNQFIIVEKYSNIPGTVSVGFAINENIIDSDSDISLQDNAAGFNNVNAPGADRLQLVPTLVSYATASEPTEFFALIRYVDGNPVRIRDNTEFNVIGEEMARRTFEESGNYVVNGLNVTLEETDNVAYAVVSPGKAYVYGKEVTNVSPTRLAIEPVALTQTRSSQHTGINYGQYFTYNPATTTVVDHFQLDGTRYPIYSNTDGSNQIGTCSISNLLPGKIFVFGIKKYNDEINTPILRIGNTVLSPPAGSSEAASKLYEPQSASMLFDSGKQSLQSVSNINIVRRIRQAGVSVNVDGVLTISATNENTPLTTNIMGMTNANVAVPLQTSTTNGNDVVADFDNSSNTPNVLYYTRVDSGISADTLTERVGYVKSTHTAGFGNSGNPLASLGIANVIEIISVFDNGGNTDATSGTIGKDVTHKFRLNRNQKDDFYGHSFISLRSGETLSNPSLLIKFRFLERTTLVNSGFLTANSYNTVTSKSLVIPHTSIDGIVHNLLDSYDFRPYADASVSVAFDAGGASSVGTFVDYTFSRGVAVMLNSVVSGDQTYYMSRIDRVVLDEYSNLSIVKGGASENPSAPKVGRLYVVGEITSPGNTTKVTGEDRLYVKNLSSKNYTMEDIAFIDRRLDALTDTVALSLLEQRTADMAITTVSDTGVVLDRFKNGILTDSFSGLLNADISDGEFLASIDKTRTIIAPGVKQFPIDLKIDPTSASNTRITFTDVVTLADSGSTSTVIDQPYATAFRNCVSNFYDFRGQVVIYPPFSSGYDVIQNPAVNIEIDIAGPMSDLVNNMQEINPLTREEMISETRTGTNRPRRRVIMGEFDQTWEETSLTSTTSSSTQAVGNFVTDINMQPYLRSEKIQIVATGLRPNTQHHFFFDGKDVDQYVAPGRLGPYIEDLVSRFEGKGNQINVKTVFDQGDGVTRQNSGQGRTVKSNDDGTLIAMFYLPEGQFFVGQNNLEIVDVDTYNSIDSASTSYGLSTYRGYNFDVNKSEMNVTTRTIDFDTSVNVTRREVQRQVGDPLAQTFRVKSTSTADANIIQVSDVELFFKKKSETVGVTVQIREVENGYPTKKVLPFAARHLSSADVKVSADGTLATKFQFTNPIILNANSEYAIVVIPDGNSPDYLIYTCKVGDTSLSKGTSPYRVAVTNDWGDGVLFTSTNDSAWKSYQDEDVKFVLNRFDYSTSVGHIDLVPNDIESLTLREGAGNFKLSELAYIKKDVTQYSGSITGQIFNILTIPQTSLPFSVGDYIYVEKNGKSAYNCVAKVMSSTVGSGSTEIILDRSVFSENTSVFVGVCVGGEVSHFNPRYPNSIQLKESSARLSNYIDDSTAVNNGNFVIGDTYTIVSLGNMENANWNTVGASGTAYVGQVFTAAAVSAGAGYGLARPNMQLITGYESGATAYITSVNNEKISFFQPQVFVHNSINTTTDLELYRNQTNVKSISNNENIYTLDTPLTIASKSRIVADNNESTDLKIRVNMSNKGKKTDTPLLDQDISELFAYKYIIDEAVALTSKFISKPVILKEGLDAVGLTVLLAAYRPVGTIVDVYARFTYPEDTSNMSAWIQLDNKTPDLYSNLANTKDYRDFEYVLSDETNSYSAFQIKFVMRHATTSELVSPDLNNVDPDINIFPHLYDYRAIALT